MKPGSAPRSARAVLLFLTVAILASVLAAPYTLPANSVDGLSGEFGSINNIDIMGSMNPFAKAVYYAGDVLSDQTSENSYYLNGNQMPFPSRAVGLFFGLMLGALAAVAIRSRTRPRVLLGVVPMLVDWSLQFTSEYTSTNTIRLITAVVAGIVIALFVATAFNTESAPEPPRPADKEQ